MKVSRTDILIKKARNLSGNTDYDEDYGINDEPFIISLNDAQIEVQSAIVEEDACAFVDYIVVPIVPEQEAYDVPASVFIDNLIYSVEYSRNGDTKHFYPLDDAMYRAETYRGEPEEYIVDGGKIYINPIPNLERGALRIRFERGLDKLDVRRGQVVSTTIRDDFRHLETITLDIGADGTSLEGAEYVCVNDKYGNVRMRNIPIASWDSSSSIITVQGDFEALPTDLEVRTGDYITIGEDTTTHSKLKYICEPYLYNVAAYDAMREHSSTDSQEQNEKLSRLMKRIVNVYSRLPSGKTLVPERRRI